MNSLTVLSPSKLNLYLKIVGRRKDGFHQMVTLFHRISLVDKLTLKKRPEGVFKLRASSSSIPTGKKNIITQAYLLLKKEIPDLPGVEVYLDKKIPMGGGLGGGSGNAASFLLGIKKMYGLRVSLAKLVAIGKRLGADVPFFLYEVNQAIGVERGDEITKLPLKQKRWFLLVLSRQGLSTKKVFQNLAFKRSRAILTKAKRTARILSNFLSVKKLRQISKIAVNDLQEPAFQIRPSLRKVIKTLNAEGGDVSLMSGSGATLYSIFSSELQARKAARRVRKLLPTKTIIVCHTF